LGEHGAFLGKSAESLASAGDDFVAGRYNSCARSAYYAAFQAAVAALMNENIGPTGNWEHDFVQAQFQGRLVYRRKLYPARYRRALRVAFDARADADYTPRQTTRREAQNLLQIARDIVISVEERLRDGS